MPGENNGEELTLHRGGRRIRVERHPTVFTVLQHGPQDGPGQAALVLPPNSKRLFRARNDMPSVYKVTVDADRRDAVIGELRRIASRPVVNYAYVDPVFPGSAYYLTDRIIVRLGNSPADRREALEQMAPLGGEVIRNLFDDSEDWKIVRVRHDSQDDALRISDRLSRLKGIAYAEPDLIDRVYGYIPRGAYLDADLREDAGSELAKLWHLVEKDLCDMDPASVLDQSSILCGPAVWQDPLKIAGAGITAAVVDLGFDKDQQDLKDAYVSPADLLSTSDANNDHGTACAGLIAARLNGVGVAGVAPEVKLLALRCEDGGDGQSGKGVVPDSVLAVKLQAAGKAARVVSFSLSWSPCGPPARAVLDAMSEKSPDSLFFVAAGNDGLPAGIRAPANKPFWYQVPSSTGLQFLSTTGPIDDSLSLLSNVVFVGACTSQKKKATYSNWCSPRKDAAGKIRPVGITIVAPSGEDVPEVLNTELGVTADNDAQPRVWSTGFQRLRFPHNGTSAATPIAAGVAVLILSANPALTAAQVKKIIEDTADQIGEGLDPNSKYVEDNTGRKRSAYMGYGKVNAAKAVQKALAP
jgi:subtilase family protein/fervidolysin-like protein